MYQSNPFYRIKIISYNIHSGRNFWMRSSINNIIRYLKTEHADIIGLQEINENSKRGNQVTKIKEALDMQEHFGSTIPFAKGHYGIATFSKHPIFVKNRVQLPSRWEKRCFIDSTILINESLKIHVINTHLGLNSKERAKQLAIISNYLETLTSPYILLGDFNDVNIDANHFGEDVAKQMGMEQQSTIMYHKKRIDYIFVSKDIEILDYQVRLTKMSDHYPLVAELAFNKSRI